MNFKTFRIAGMIALASLALSFTAWANCSNASLSGTYGFLHDSTDTAGAPATAAITQITFDPNTGTFTGLTTASHGGVIVTSSVNGTYTNRLGLHRHRYTGGSDPFLHCGYVKWVLGSSRFCRWVRYQAGFSGLHQCPSCWQFCV